MLKKINIITLQLLFLSVLLPILLILMLEHITISETLGNMDSGSFGKSYELVCINFENFEPKILFTLMDQVKEQIAVTSDGCIDGINIRAIYFNKKYVNLPMKEGRFFEKKDFTENNNCAVIGKKMLDITYLKEKKRYIILNGIEFKVIGVLGYECDTVLDNYIYINGYSQNSVFTSSFLEFDFLEKENGTIMDFLEESIHDYGMEFDRLSSQTSYFNTLIPRLLYSRWFIVVFFCVILCLILLSLEWILHQKKEIGIRQLLGANRKDIVFLLLKRFFKIIFVSVFFSGIYVLLFHTNYKRFLFVGYCISIPVLFLFLFIILLRLMKTPLEEVIKS